MLLVPLLKENICEGTPASHAAAVVPFTSFLYSLYDKKFRHFMKSVKHRKRLRGGIEQEGYPKYSFDITNFIANLLI